jgi:hypothetical protein
MKEIILQVDSMNGVERVDVKKIDPEKGVSVVLDGTRILQYIFDLTNEAKWTEETAMKYVQVRAVENVIQSKVSAELSFLDTVQQNQLRYLPDEIMRNLMDVDPDPYFVELKVKYGVGSNKQHFDRPFFEKAGAKFEGKPFLYNHSDISEFGSGIPIGAIVKFLGAEEDHAKFAAYVSASEGTLRQKIKESRALGQKGYVKEVSIEGLPSRDDYTVDDKTGIKYFRDLKNPSGIALVNLAGMRGSQII